jgi:hypothetical protein
MSGSPKKHAGDREADVDVYNIFSATIIWIGAWLLEEPLTPSRDG